VTELQREILAPGQRSLPRPVRLVSSDAELAPWGPLLGWELLASVTSVDVAAGRLFEPHMDAQAILANN
jgi:hypothetical protein